MIFSIGIVFLVLSALAINKKVLLQSDDHRKAISQGCESPPEAVPRWNIFGTIRMHIDMIRAARKGEIHSYFKGLFTTASSKAGFEVRTIFVQRPGAHRIVTIDAENIHAVLTTRHHDFGPGARKQALEPFTGRHTIASTEDSFVASKRY